MDSSILKKIKALPPLDDTVMQIQRICTDKNSSLNDLVKVVEGDPMLTANILKSSKIGVFRPVNKPHQSNNTAQSPPNTMHFPASSSQTSCIQPPLCAKRSWCKTPRRR